MFGVTSINGLSNMEDAELKKLINYNGFYRGFVVSTDDPMHLGRVKVRVPAIHGADPNLDTYMSDNTLPWAFPGIFPLAGPNMGQLILPYIGSTVWVTFEVDQPNNAIYFGNLYSTAPKGEKFIQGPRFIYQGTQLQCTKDDLDAYKASLYTILKTLKGASITIDDSDMKECIELKDAFGQYFRMKNNGEVLNYGMTPSKDNCEIEFGSGKSSISISNKGINLKGELSYQTCYFVNVSKVSDDYNFNLGIDQLFSDRDLKDVVTSVKNGARVAYINSEGNIVGSGIITDSTVDSVIISSSLAINPYPVGSCYIAVKGVDPNKEFGGEWNKMSNNVEEPICWVRVA